MQKLGLTEFTEVFYDNLDDVITTSLVHIDENKDFYDEIIFRMFDVYQREDNNYTVKELIKFFHIFLHSMFTYQPSVERNQDTIKTFS